MEQTLSPAPTIEHLVSLWPVIGTLSQHLPVGDLITLARLSASLRALLHGFELPEEIDSQPVRPTLNIGHHNTPSWHRLKSLSPFTCSSRGHTKGPAPKPCRFCSRPICGACMVRDSINKKENTFPNRVRHLCKKCWDTGNPSRTEQYPLKPETAEEGSGSESESKKPKQWYGSGSTKDTCTCTLKDHGTLCLECKTDQNTTALSLPSLCHGQNCTTTLTPLDISHHRVCLWCNSPLPRPLGGPNRLHWNQKIIEARARDAASRTADLSEYNRKRLHSLTMSRREMRGDEAVENDPEADLPQFVRHLDTINYKTHMPDAAAPSPEAVFASKRGYWRYSAAFLLAIRPRCAQVPSPPEITSLRTEQLDNDDDDNGLRLSRTNGETAYDSLTLSSAMPNISKPRLSRWTSLKPVLLSSLQVQKLDYEAIQSLMREEYGFDASVEEYADVTQVWTTQAMRRRSLEDEDARAATEKGKASALFGRRTPYIKGQPVDSETDLYLGSGSTPNSAGLATETAISDTHPSQHPNYEDLPGRRHISRRNQPSFPRAFAQNSSSSSQPPPTLQTPASPSSTTTSLLLSASEATISDPDPDLGALASLYLPISNLADDRQVSTEEPPPYSADGWIWPGEADPPHEIEPEYNLTGGAG